MRGNFWEGSGGPIIQRMSPEDTAKKQKEEAIEKWEKLKEGYIKTGNKDGIIRANEALKRIGSLDNNP
jgi:hypothetical protein